MSFYHLLNFFNLLTILSDTSSLFFVKYLPTPWYYGTLRALISLRTDAHFILFIAFCFHFLLFFFPHGTTAHREPEPAN